MSSTNPSCPCEFPEIEACRKSCSCRTPHLSGGCYRCATYGSQEQRLTKARWIAERLDDVVMAERDRLRTQCFDLETKVRILELDLSRAKKNSDHYRRLWNTWANEAAKLRRQISDMMAKRQTSPKTRKVRHKS